MSGWGERMPLVDLKRASAAMRRVTAQHDAAVAEADRLRAVTVELAEGLLAARAETAALRERIENQIIEWRTMAEGDSTTVGHVLDACADDLAAAVPSVPTEQPETCGHPNHGAHDHDCRPFLAEHPETTAEPSTAVRADTAIMVSPEGDDRALQRAIRIVEERQ